MCRAATPETRAHVPYNIVLVDTAEGFRMMAHGDNDLAIGDKVTARFGSSPGRLVPYFAKAAITMSGDEAIQIRGYKSGLPQSLLPLQDGFYRQ